MAQDPTLVAASDHWTQNTPAANRPHLGGYVRLPLAMLRRHDAPRWDWYAMYEGSHTPTRVARAEARLSEHEIDDLDLRGYQSLYVRGSDFQGRSALLLQSLEAILGDESIPPSDRFMILARSAAGELDRQFRPSDCGAYFELSQRIGALIANLVGRLRVTPSDIFTIRTESEGGSFGAHALYASAYAVTLADALGMADDNNRRQLAIGALLHDIGERRLPLENFTKSSLSEVERQMIYKHPQIGYEDLLGRDGIEFAQLMMVYQHHEWVDGHGYPVQILREEIHPWARVLAVVDEFDSLTCNRIPQASITLEDTIKHLSASSGSQLDKEAVRCWTSLFRRR
ncbi:Cyclic di-GMP phosphodiesterase response regulator RpfG [Pseudobythopirellula maris]|uniref:Cyclic di-GMP phosphodiesterase response regulator RpfG n=1 Tax=Pseudobythopirellula maris TaxID=2527991 RepID=A0A5C5ZN94_9BACT|nr:HD domain-containing phosphohydrolase [Pseudobythopirellula maris]TWT88962.1 Cyclic di-GMP phosphodiesterase response regulator RpfG [Pseudobythopirellula maris]